MTAKVVLFATRQAFFPGRVLDIVCLGTDKDVSGVNAENPIAGMERKES